MVAQAQVPHYESGTGVSSTGALSLPHYQCPSASTSGTPGCGDTLLVQVLLHLYTAEYASTSLGGGEG